MSDEAGPTGPDSPLRDSGEARRRFLFAIDGEHARDLLPLVCDLVADADAELLVAAPVSVPEQTPLSMPKPRQEAERLVARIALEAKETCQGSPPIHQVVKLGRRRGDLLEGLVETYDVSMVITDDSPRPGRRSRLGIEGVDDGSLAVDCDTILVTRTARPADIDSILVPIARGPHSGLAIDTGLALASQNDASLELLHVHPKTEEGRSDGRAVLEHGLDRVGSCDAVEPTLHEASDVPAAIVEYTDPFDVTVLGAPREGLIRQFVLGSIPDSVSAAADGTVLVAHRGGTDESWVERWL